MRTVKVIVVLLLIATAGAAGWYYGRSPSDPRDWRSKIEYEDVLPTFVEPGDGPRAPSNAAFGLTIGRTTADEAWRWAIDRSLVCKDTSVRALLATYRDKKAAEMVAAEAEGRADGIAGATYLAKSTKHERSPQLRLTCERVRLSTIGDRNRPQDAIGRILMIFDSKDHPLRHFVVQAKYSETEHEAARLAFLDAEAALKARFGEPGIVRGDPPAPGSLFAPVQPLRREWKFADIDAKVSALRFGPSVTVFEEVGVPWPVRPDAPVLAAAPR